jgi:hypothetical protein
LTGAHGITAGLFLGVVLLLVVYVFFRLKVMIEKCGAK